LSARAAPAGADAGSRHEAPGLDLDKPVYTISVASEILETHPRTLMMYENLGLILPARTTTNRRRFSQRDIIRLQVIQMLTVMEKYQGVLEAAGVGLTLGLGFGLFGCSRSSNLVRTWTSASLRRLTAWTMTSRTAWL
jgi:hypothetical protein